MNAHQRRVLARVAGVIDEHDRGLIPARVALNRIWGLHQAAELPTGELREQFEDLFYAATAADDARQPSMPPGLGSDAEFETAMARLAAWSRAAGARNTADRG